MKVLALSGGGSNGDWQAGRLKALVERGHTWDAILGVSVGALNGIALATGQENALEDIWLNMSQDKIYKRRKPVRLGLNYLFYKVGIRKPLKGIYDTSPLRKMLAKLLLNKRVVVDYYCGIVVITERSVAEYIEYKIPKGTIIEDSHVEFILASASIPVVFDPVIIDKDILVDGGLIYHSPLNRVIRDQPVTHVTGISCQSLNEVFGDVPIDLIDFSGWTIATLLRNQFKDQWSDMLRWNQAAAIAQQNGIDLIIDGIKVKHLELDLHFPHYNLGNSLNFDNRKTTKNYWNGYQGAWKKEEIINSW